MSELIQVVQHGNFVEVALNRPEVFNAFNFEMLSELTTVLTRLSMDGSVKGIVLTGRGKAFCAGGDLRLAVNFCEKSGSSLYKMALQLHLSVIEIRRMNKPVVAAVNGGAFQDGDKGHREVAVRINSLATDWGKADYN